MTADVSELRGLAHDFGKASLKTLNAVDAVLEKAANAVKTSMRDDAQSKAGGGHAKAFPSSISYDRAYKRIGEAAYEVGPDKDRRQGALGNLLYFGSANNGPVLDIEVGMNDEAPRLTKALLDLAASQVVGRG